MPHPDRGNAYTVLSSDWAGLSPHLIAVFYPVRLVEGSQNGPAWERVPNSIEVQAPITDGTIEQSATWTSPFESQVADAKLSTFSSMLQSGGFHSTLQALSGLVSGAAKGLIDDLNKKLDGLVGKSAITKLNSEQIFTGMPPMKINITAHFRATSDPKAEVQQPVSKLMEWTLPKKLSNAGVVTNTIKGAGVVDSLYSSEAPQIIGMKFADMLFLPVVIESMTMPLTGPRDSSGTMITTQTTLSISTLTALDGADWAKAFTK